MGRKKTGIVGFQKGLQSFKLWAQPGAPIPVGFWAHRATQKAASRNTSPKLKVYNYIEIEIQPKQDKIEIVCKIQLKRSRFLFIMIILSTCCNLKFFKCILLHL
jgi:hypothetical protein